MYLSTKKNRGFTLIESLVSIFVFALLAGAVSGTMTAITRQTKTFREGTTISGIADEYLEIARNLPYSQIGTMSGNPHGTLPDLPNATTTTINNNTYKIYYAVSYVDDPADGTIVGGTDPAPNDYKQIKLYIKNLTTNVLSSFFTNIAPKGLEGLNNAGALIIKVFDAVGQGVPNATVTITNTQVFPQINLTRTTDSMGNWIEVGLPVSANSYHVAVTKSGYSNDQTYPSSVGNPNPTKPDATIVNGQVTQVSFSIDHTSNLTFNTLNTICAPIPNINLAIQGAKIIGTPAVYKFTNSYNSNASGQIALNNIEWDTYVPALSSNSYMIYGSSPIQQINLLPNTTQQFTFVLGPKTQNALLVTVKDNGTNNPLEGAKVVLKQDGDTVGTKYTDGSIWVNSDWSGGSGQANFVTTNRYFSDDGNTNTTGTPTGVRLRSFGTPTTYASSGILTSSTFDTGTNQSSYTTFEWQPTSQDASTTLSFQIATNNDNATWNYVGPDGTGATYFTVPSTTINTAQSNQRYVRYKAFLTTDDPNKTPTLTSVNINYVSGCSTPGQVIFTGLENHNDYQVTTSLTGYQTQTITTGVSGYTVLLPVLLTP